MDVYRRYCGEVCLATSAAAAVAVGAVADSAAVALAVVADLAVAGVVDLVAVLAEVATLVVEVREVAGNNPCNRWLEDGELWLRL